MSRDLRIALATEEDRQTIYALRHQVYACELEQHLQNSDGRIRDALDDENVYIVVHVDDAIAGFVSVTPPTARAYSLDKYLRRDEIPFALDEGTFEIRILTVLPAYRGTSAPLLLMYAAFRWVEAHGGSRIVAIGRREVRSVYEKCGLRTFGREFRSGAVDFVLMSERVTAIREHLSQFDDLLQRMEETAQWDLIIPFHKPADCFHGGAFFEAIGDEFDQLDRVPSVINADVLDAWFPPSPRVIAALQQDLPWLLRTSPPTACEGLARRIARARGVDSRSILPGAGSSALIFLAFREWLRGSSRVLLPEPTYGEYAHVLENVIRCRVDRLALSRDDDYDLDLARIDPSAFDLIVLVNPNSPTGRHIPRAELESFLLRVPASTLVWIDETYVDFVDPRESLEPFAVTRPNVVVCKSMSKVYALSGARSAYLCASPHLLERLRAITPPWAVSLPGQVAAVAALGDPAYYAQRYRETAALRAELGASLTDLDVVRGRANFVLFHLPEDGPTAAEIVARCRPHGLFVRDASTMGSSLGSHAVRIAVKDRPTNERMLDILSSVGVRVRQLASFVAMLVVVCLAAFPLDAGVNRWTDSGPPRTTDCSAHRAYCNDIRAFALHPFDEKTIYAIMTSGSNESNDVHSLWRSTDGGENWTRLPFRSAESYDDLLSLGISRNDPQVLYILSRNAFFRSADGGETWTRTQLPNWSAWNTTLAVDPTNGDTVYVGQEKFCLFSCIDGGVHRTDNGGRSWRERGLNRKTVTRIAVDPFQRSTLYAVAEDRIYQTTNGGSAWKDISPTGDAYSMIVVDPLVPTTLYAATGGHYLNTFSGIFRSYDRGRTWQPIEGQETNGSSENHVAVDPINTNHLLARVSPRSILRSTDGGATWVPFHDGIEGPAGGPNAIGGLLQLVIAPSGSTFYALFEGGYLFRYSLVPQRRRAVRK